jgi:hypothetical protein
MPVDRLPEDQEYCKCSGYGCNCIATPANAVILSWRTVVDPETDKPVHFCWACVGANLLRLLNLRNVLQTITAPPMLEVDHHSAANAGGGR